MYRRIEKPYFSQPIGQFERFGNDQDNLIIDSQGNILEVRGNEFLKLGYVSPLVDSLYRYVPAVGFGVLLSNLFFPARSRNSDTNVVMLIIGLVIGLMFSYGVFIGWLVNIFIMNRFDKLVVFLEKNKVMRLFVPHYWFTGNAKITGYLHLGMPVFLFLAIISFVIAGGDSGSFMGTVFAFNFFAFFVSLICMLLDLLYNSLAKVIRY